MTMALQGYAIWYNRIVPLHRGENKLILPSAFDRTLNSGSTVRLLINHLDHQCIASTDDSLTFYNDGIGLAFRCELPYNETGRRARAMAESRCHDGMSIGFNYAGAITDRRKIDGAEVVVVIDAWLNEVSFLDSLTGAMPSAFASYENIDNSSLREDCESGKLACDCAAVGLRRSLRKLLKESRFS